MKSEADLEEDLKILSTVIRNQKRNSASSSSTSAATTTTKEEREEFDQILKKRERELLSRTQTTNRKDLERMLKNQQGEIPLMRKLDLVFIAILVFAFYVFVKIKFGVDLFLYFITPRRS